ncbi:MAG: ice-binding family protein [Candidatus Electrothrix scaldis]|nr:MAG: ice-binding family protein [Candidatus Electrothrix sp. GW3-3]
MEKIYALFQSSDRAKRMMTGLLGLLFALVVLFSSDSFAVPVSTTIANTAPDLTVSRVCPVPWLFLLLLNNKNAHLGPSPVDLGDAGTFAILSKTGITDDPQSPVVGDVGTSPITGAALHLTCAEVTGNIYTVDAAGPLPCSTTNATFLTSAVGDMELAYDDAAGRVLPDFTELGAGEIGGLTLVPGLYSWSSTLLISTDVTLSGGPDDVWIFQVAGDLKQSSFAQVTLASGALAKNIFWQVADSVTLGTYAHFEGIILGKTGIAVNTGASVNGRLLAQTAVTLQQNAITAPAD